jgi:hypothetical protein
LFVKVVDWSGEMLGRTLGSWGLGGRFV